MNQNTNQNTVQNIAEWLEDDMRCVNDTIMEYMQSPVELIPQLAGHLITAGGKRIRPLLTLLAAKLVGYEGNKHIIFAACTEFIHSATLLHDDVVDESDRRRGLDSANQVWGNQASVLVGDFLFSRAFQMMVKGGSLKAHQLLADTSATIAEGEVNQLRLKNAPDSGEELYLQVINGKTAALFAASAGIVGCLEDSINEAHYEALYAYGRYLGMAFQLIDDALDYDAEVEKLGKSIGDDFAEGKVTMPIILAWQKATEEEKTFLIRTMKELKQTDTDFATVQKILQKHKSLEQTRQYAKRYGDMALKSLSPFVPSQAKKYMEELIEFCLKREY